MKIIVTHASPDWDAIGSVWVIRRFLPGWQHAKVEFVQPGEASDRVRSNPNFLTDSVLRIGDDEIIHVDTGLGPLDHHQDNDDTIASASKSWDFVRHHVLGAGEKFSENHEESVSRMMKVLVGYDHFKEVFLPDALSDYHDFSLQGLLDGMKLEKQGDDLFLIDFGTQCLQAMFQRMENKVWTEKEARENGILFETKYGKGIALETTNHVFLKYAQRLGYVIVLRKDPRSGYVAMAARPAENKEKTVDFTLVCEQLRKMDPEATWFLHVSKKLLLNGSTKNPKMKPTKLSLDQIISVITRLYA